jgi:biopolymer transport protein ExbB/TolQ
LSKQIVLVCVVVLVGFWQSHFVLQVMHADVYIFALLVCAGTYGIFSTLHATYSLGNDFVALEALKEIHQDALRKATAPEDHARILDERLSRDKLVYSAPNSLGTAHNLIVEEILRSGSLRIPTSTMQVLVSDLESKLDERKGNAHYFGALMVLLGLLGTFIGLMHTLESVGGILGSLSGGGGAGAEGSGTIAGLIESLKRPLDGMATGFGASLFGLVGSLIIGLLSKFDNKAAHRLQQDFETWIRSTVQIEAPVAAGAVMAGVSRGEPSEGDRNWRTIFQVARQTVLATAKMSNQISELNRTVSGLVQENRTQGDQNGKLIKQVAWHLNQETASQDAIAARIDAMGDTLRGPMDDLQSRVAALSGAMEAQGLKQQEAIAARMEAVGQSLRTPIDDLQSRFVALSSTVEAQGAKQQEAIAARVEAVGQSLRAPIEDLQSRLFTLNNAVETHSVRQNVLFDKVGENLKKLSENMLWHQEALNETDRKIAETQARVNDLHEKQAEMELAGSQKASTRAEAIELLATLDHMIAATRLSKEEVDRLRQLSQIVDLNEMRASKSNDTGSGKLKELAK